MSLYLSSLLNIVTNFYVSKIRSIKSSFHKNEIFGGSLSIITLYSEAQYIEFVDLGRRRRLLQDSAFFLNVFLFCNRCKNKLSPKIRQFQNRTVIVLIFTHPRCRLSFCYFLNRLVHMHGNTWTAFKTSIYAKGVEETCC